MEGQWALHRTPSKPWGIIQLVEELQVGVSTRLHYGWKSPRTCLGSRQKRGLTPKDSDEFLVIVHFEALSSTQEWPSQLPSFVLRALSHVVENKSYRFPWGTSVSGSLCLLPIPTWPKPCRAARETWVLYHLHHESALRRQQRANPSGSRKIVVCSLYLLTRRPNGQWRAFLDNHYPVPNY